MNIIAITGNIASGKTTISRIISEHFDLPLISVDDFSLHYIKSHELIFKGILQEYGYECKQNEIRETLKKLFFKDKTLKSIIEHHVATVFWNYINNRSVYHFNKNILVEYPTLFERRDTKQFGYIIGVYANSRTRDGAISCMIKLGYEVKCIFFENDKEKCLNNIRHRNDGRVISKDGLASFRYEVPDGIETLKIWQANEM